MSYLPDPVFDGGRARVPNLRRVGEMSVPLAVFEDLEGGRLPVQLGATLRRVAGKLAVPAKHVHDDRRAPLAPGIRLQPVPLERFELADLEGGQKNNC